jgi:1,4-alpha-glucan branching enzyme
MNDTLEYISNDPVHRRYHHHELTFGLIYAFTENFVLPLSHDEVVHGKGSILDRMPGDVWQKFANLRAYYGFMWGYPGKKLLFMGQEFGQWNEWNFRGELDWLLLEFPAHAGVRLVVGDLNRLYRENGALHARDCEGEGFSWIAVDDADQSVAAWARFGAPGDAPIAVVCNFTPVPRHGYRIGLPSAGYWREIFNSDASSYGGSGLGNGGGVTATDQPWNGWPASAEIIAPPLATIFLRRDS